MSNQIYHQMYYSVKNRLNMRLISLAVVVVGNIFLSIISAGSDFTQTPRIFAITFSSFAFIGVVAVNMFVTFSNLNSIFKAPKGYLLTLTPVPSWKILLGNTIPAAFFDIIAFTIGIIGILFQTLSLTLFQTPSPALFQTSDTTIYFAGANVTDVSLQFAIAFAIISSLVYYLLLLMSFAFWRAISNSILFQLPFRNFFGAVVTITAMIALSWFNILQAPFGEFNNIHMIFYIHITEASYFHYILTILITILQVATMLFAAAHLLERKINL